MHPPEDLTERTFRFVCDVYDFCETLARDSGLPRRLAYQLFDAAGSVGANREEAKAAYSRKEFASKNSISLKECREANYWLRVAEIKGLGDSQETSDWFVMRQTSHFPLSESRDGRP